MSNLAAALCVIPIALIFVMPVIGFSIPLWASGSQSPRKKDQIAMNIASLLTHLAKADGNSFYHAIVLIKDKDKNSGRPSIPIAFEVNDGEVSFYERANIEDGISRAIQHHKAIHSVVLYEGERIVATIDDNYQVSLPKNSP